MTIFNYCVRIGESTIKTIDQQKIDFYSRKNQTEELAKLFDQILAIS